MSFYDWLIGSFYIWQRNFDLRVPFGQGILSFNGFSAGRTRSFFQQLAPHESIFRAEFDASWRTFGQQFIRTKFTFHQWNETGFNWVSLIMETLNCNLSTIQLAKTPLFFFQENASFKPTVILDIQIMASYFKRILMQRPLWIIEHLLLYDSSSIFLHKFYVLRACNDKKRWKKLADVATLLAFWSRWQMSWIRCDLTAPFSTFSRWNRAPLLPCRLCWWRGPGA